MSSEKPILVVLGATGNQGGSVISYFLSLSPSPYAIRGVTRDPSSSKSVSLASLGVEMVAADFDDPSSLQAAFKGASVIFSVTDFWQSFKHPSTHERASASGQSVVLAAMEHEFQQNRNIIDAAAKVDTIDRFVFHSMAYTNKLSGGKYDVYHFDGKAKGEEYGKSAYPKLWEKTSVFYAGYYLENYFAWPGDRLLPVLNEDKDTLTLSVSEPLATTPIPMFSVSDDTGALVHALIRAAPGKKLIGSKEWLSFRDLANILAQKLGKKVKFVEKEVDMGLEDDGSGLKKDYDDMIGFMIEFGYDGGRVDKEIVQWTDLGVPVQLESVKEWCSKQDWKKWLQME